MLRRVFWMFLGVCSLNCAVTATADVKLPTIFGSGMVLQRDQPVAVWGFAEPGEQVSVTFRDQKQSATADAAGNWKVTLSPLAVGEAAALSISGKNTVKIDNVLVGEVWICSGQSNMEWRERQAFDFDLERSAADYSGIRMFTVAKTPALEPQKDLPGAWQVCSPETVGDFSAVGYYFARDLHRVLKVPVGMIHTSWGGTPAESWTSPAGMASTSVLKPLLDSWATRRAQFNPDEAERVYQEQLKAYQEAQTRGESQVPTDGTGAGGRAAARGRGGPRRPTDPGLSNAYPSGLWNGMVAPIVGYGIRGAIWYQGESNAGRAYEYRTLMPVMIQSWRDAWKQGDFPFYQVQLANYQAIQEKPGESDWAELREAQWMATVSLPNSGAACITDLGTATDIHPRDKLNVGMRLARLALNRDYKIADIVPQGPTYKPGSLVIDGNKARVSFDTYGSRVGQYYRDPLKGFAVAGEDKVWHWAQATITGADTVEVTSPDVPKPVAVRYNWASNPLGNLHNTQMLPAYPFRTDDWKGVTADKFGL